MGSSFRNFNKSALGGSGGGGGGGGMPNMQNLMKQAQKMQEDLAAAKEQIAETTVEGISGNGAVVVTLNGNKELVSIKLDKAVVDPDDTEMLEDLIVASFNDAKAKADKVAAELMPDGTNGIL